MRVVWMKPGWKLFLLFVAVFAVALGAERLFVPHVAPIGFTEEAQPLWSLETAFVLRAIELMSGGVAAISLVMMFAAWATQIARRRAH
jgi:hypothetical protein